MAELALAFYVVYLSLAFGLRSLLQWRATGSTGFIGVGGRPGSPEWLAGVLFVVALAMGATAPALALADALEPVDALNQTAAHATGIGLALLGVCLTLYAQIAMGASWRIGVNPDERTDLVTSGPFAVVRNPIFAAMIPTALGLTLMVPSVLAIFGFVALIVALELQVRVVEEPYLVRVQGAAYARYAAQTGRFVPRAGTLGRVSGSR